MGKKHNGWQNVGGEYHYRDTLKTTRRLLAYGVIAAQLGLAVASPAAGQIRLPRPTHVGVDAEVLAATWRDRETRSVTYADTDETDVFLSLLPLTNNLLGGRITMVFRARYRNRRPIVPPGSLEFRVRVGPLYAPRLQPVINFELDRGTEDARRVDLSGQIQYQALGTHEPPREVVFTLPVGLQLLHLINADTVDGNVLGSTDFMFSQAQIEALREYVTRILSVGQRRTRQGR